MTQKIEQLSINTIRTLSIDAIENANSGHPGMPMGAAPMAYTLWTQFMKHNPRNPEWFNRDRFVLSAGHGSMLLYSLLHLFNYDVTIEDLKNFRQWGSKTPGHPEVHHTPGVDATTGPLGQGIAMAVGMAMAERHLAGKYNRQDYSIVDHHTYAICGDGDLMEGVSGEAASLAGHLNLGRLVVLYDSNDISLDGDLNMAFSEDVLKRFEAYGWQTLRVEDGNDIDAIHKALKEANAEQNKPTMIEVKTTIGYGAPNKCGTSSVHGSPLGEEEVIAAKANYGWDHEPFFVPEDVRDHFAAQTDKGVSAEEEWHNLFSDYKNAHPELAKELENAIAGKLPDNYDAELPHYQVGDDKATRATSNEVINALAGSVPQLFGGAADLASSTKTLMKDNENFTSATYEGRNIWFGVREFAMAAAVNGMGLHGGVIPYGSTFFVFSDYLRPALRLSALMSLPVTYVFTHDSIAVGEDGPTHEPIEQLASLRAIPNLSVIRPADGNETREAWKLAVESQDHPTALVLTRQGLPTMEGTVRHASEGVEKGAYVVSEAKEAAEGLILATGSEVGLAVRAQEMLASEGTHVSVISMPSWDRFEQQDQAYKDQILPPSLTKRLGVEVGASLGWHKYVGTEGALLTIDRFGASAKGEKVMEEYGFTPENVAEMMKKLIK
ncbi:transketolase [Scopulibacillus darangshiensis]|uniref:Transketolase n=1 Tax=Scopulibacillus darangshiensis TaxID=442528 RepID=A0A4R2P891_9BACL|nr:transketolase [Scopulibacillus darangshiensis]TCP30231.1 transketolase [Scopulibacillus darangshiensis]